MAKAGFWLRGAKGKLAGSTIVKQNGATVIREIPTEVKNPKTEGQMLQRARFANCVKFYKHAQQAFFKFAFESKKKGESDYNAFVRLNVKESPVLDYDTVQNPLFPAIMSGNTIMTQGSLGVTEVSHNGERAHLVCMAATGEETTWGEVSRAIIAEFPGVQAGDFITFVGINSNVANIDDVPTKAPYWNIHQVVIDPNDNGDIPDLISTREHYVTFDTQTSADYASAVCVCISRDTVNGVKVTTSLLEVSDPGHILVNSLTDSYRAFALESWGSTGKAILQGSIVENGQQQTGVVVGVNGSPVPHNAIVSSDMLPTTPFVLTTSDGSEVIASQLESSNSDFELNVSGNTVTVSYSGTDAADTTSISYKGSEIINLRMTAVEPSFTGFAGAAASPAGADSIDETNVGESLESTFSASSTNYVRIEGSNLAAIDLSKVQVTRTDGGSVSVNKTLQESKWYFILTIGELTSEADVFITAKYNGSTIFSAQLENV